MNDKFKKDLDELKTALNKKCESEKKSLTAFNNDQCDDQKDQQS